MRSQSTEPLERQVTAKSVYRAAGKSKITILMKKPGVRGLNLKK
jgi:hypothetical protein